VKTCSDQVEVAAIDAAGVAQEHVANGDAICQFAKQGVALFVDGNRGAPSQRPSVRRDRRR